MKPFSNPPLTKTEWAIVAIYSLIGLIAWYLYGSVVFP